MTLGNFKLTVVERGGRFDGLVRITLGINTLALLVVSRLSIFTSRSRLHYPQSAYRKIQERYPDKEVYLVENNAGGHVNASEIMEEYRNKHGILKAPHPPNSPDLNMIEGL